MSGAQNSLQLLTEAHNAKVGAQPNQQVGTVTTMPPALLRMNIHSNSYRYATGWWAYELSPGPGGVVKQFHLQEAANILGRFQSSRFDSNVYQEFYSDGDACGTSVRQPRTTVVRWECGAMSAVELNQRDAELAASASVPSLRPLSKARDALVFSVLEPSECNYVMVVKTPNMCH